MNEESIALKIYERGLRKVKVGADPDRPVSSASAMGSFLLIRVYIAFAAFMPEASTQATAHKEL